MPVAKRKRLSDATVTNEAANGAIDDEAPKASTPPTSVADECPFSVQVLKNAVSLPKKKSKSGKHRRAQDRWTVVKLEDHISPDEHPVAYAVSPGKAWEKMKKYKHFEVVGTKRIGGGDFLYINNGSCQAQSNFDEESQLWVAQVLEIRAASSSEVYLRVFWMYWPEELPMGRQPYHGKDELIASNSMDILDALTVANVAEVTHVLESDEHDLPVVDTLYWRQKFDVRTNKISQLKRGCICNEPHNPDKLLVRCGNDACKRWLHEECLVQDALRRHWKARNSPAPAVAGISPSDAAAADYPSDTIRVTPRPLNLLKKMVTKKDIFDGWAHHRRRSSLNSKKAQLRPGRQPRDEPWGGKLRGYLQRRLDEFGKETGGITGKVVIEALSNGGEKEYIKEENGYGAREKPVTLIDTLCLFCQTLLEEEKDDEKNDGDVAMAEGKEGAGDWKDLKVHLTKEAEGKGQENGDSAAHQNSRGEFTTSQEKAAVALLAAATGTDDGKEAPPFTPPDDTPTVVGII